MYHLGVHIDYRYVSLLFIRVHIVFMHCSSPTVLSHVPFVAFLLELCAVQCLLSVHVLHTTMYYPGCGLSRLPVCCAVQTDASQDLMCCRTMQLCKPMFVISFANTFVLVFVFDFNSV